MNRLQHRIRELEAQHGGLNATARVLKVDAGYLSRLASGEKDTPSDKLLRKMGLRRVVWLERLGPAQPEPARADDEPTPEDWKAMYRAQCSATDTWARIAEEKSDAALTARITELEAALATVNQRLTGAQNKLLDAGYVATPLVPGAHGNDGVQEGYASARNFPGGDDVAGVMGKTE